MAFDPTQTYVQPPAPTVSPYTTYTVLPQGSYAPAPGGYPIDPLPVGSPPDYATATINAATYAMPTYGQAPQAPAPSLGDRVQLLDLDDSDSESSSGNWGLIAAIAGVAIGVAIAGVVLGLVVNPLFFLGLLALIVIPIVYSCGSDSDNIPPDDGVPYDYNSQSNFNAPPPSYFQDQGQRGYDQNQPSVVYVDPLATLTPEYTATYVQNNQP